MIKNIQGWKKANEDNIYLKYNIPLVSVVLPNKCDLIYKIKQVFKHI